MLKNNVEYSTRSRDPPPSENDGLTPGTDGGGDASLSPTGFKAMKRNELQQLCKLKGLKANGNNKSMVTALEASMCSDMTATGGGCAADDGGDGTALNFKSLTHRELQGLCKQKKIRANDTSVNMATALEALRRSAVAAADDVSAADDDDDEDVEDDED